MLSGLLVHVGDIAPCRVALVEQRKAVEKLRVRELGDLLVGRWGRCRWLRFVWMCSIVTSCWRCCNAAGDECGDQRHDAEVGNHVEELRSDVVVKSKSYILLCL